MRRLKKLIGDCLLSLIMATATDQANTTSLLMPKNALDAPNA